MAVYWICTGPQNSKFKGSKYVSTKKAQYKRARENLGVYSTFQCFRRCTGCQLEQRFNYKLVVPMFETQQTSSLQYLSQHISLRTSARNTQSSSVPLLAVPFRRTSFARRSFSTAAPLTWNSLPPDVLNFNSLSTFKSKLICFLLLFANHSAYLFRQHLCSHLRWCFINFLYLYYEYQFRETYILHYFQLCKYYNHSFNSLQHICFFNVIMIAKILHFLHSCQLVFSYFAAFMQKELRIQSHNHIPRSRPLTNCSSSAGSTLAVFFLFSYLRCALFDRFLLIRASSSALCNNINMLTTFLQ